MEGTEDVFVHTPEDREDPGQPMILLEQQEDQWHTICVDGSETRVKDMPAEQDIMVAGAMAILQGIALRPELNGREVMILEFNVERQSYIVFGRRAHRDCLEGTSETNGL